MIQKKRVKNLKIQCMDSFNEMIKISTILIFSILPCNKALSVAKKVSKLKINRKLHTLIVTLYQRKILN